jgi:hypothetical protein
VFLGEEAFVLALEIVAPLDRMFPSAAAAVQNFDGLGVTAALERPL